MNAFNIIALLTVLAAAFSYINFRFLKLPTTIGLMAISLVMSLLIFVVNYFVPGVLTEAVQLMRSIDLSEVILDIMLSFLLFAGALHTDYERLRKYIAPIISLASIGVIVSAILVALAASMILILFDIEINFVYLLLFGVLISPTDPIAVLGILKEAKVPKKLEIKIAGESLFNDGVAVVMFLVLLSLAKNADSVTALDVVQLFGLEVFGGLIFGFAMGYIAYRLMRSISNYEVEVLITLALVMATHVISVYLHLSAPLAVVVAGLLIGNRARGDAMGEQTENYIDKFWELVDLLLNAILFVLIGLELLLVEYHINWLLAGVLLIPLVVLARYAAVWPAVQIFKKRLELLPGTAAILTWGGLRGGISIALALSLPEEMNRELILSLTYTIVVFSILVQGLTIKGLANRRLGMSEDA
ncbi:MAG TPA: sodium:proton antiporter [Flavobacteriales bacterium]|jgi:CPA1 family monovalent cation:H+ antiporter|nr:sodium:proton antiporter [Flavobacteriales bacterium]